VKYGNKPTNGYASKREAKRAAELKLLEKAGEITELSFQVPFELIPKCNGERSCKYIADAVYKERGTTVVEDTKGYRTEVYRIKKKLLRWRYGIIIREV